MAKTTDRQIVNGQTYMIMDSQARQGLNDLKSAMNAQIDGVIPNYKRCAFSIANQRTTPTGTFTSDATCMRTDYVPCAEGQTVIWYGYSFFYADESVMSLIAFYDSNKSFISSITAINNSDTLSAYGYVVTTAPQNTAYVIGATHDTNIGTLNIVTLDAADADSMINYARLFNLSAAPYLYGDIHYCEIFDGSAQNPGNPTVVHTDAIPVKAGDVIRLKTNREPTSGSRYAYGYTIYNTSSAEVKSVACSPTGDSVLAIANDGSVVYIIGEVDSNDTFVQIRPSAFIGYNVYALIDRDAVITRPQTDALYTTVFGDYKRCVLSNGTAPNPNNAFAVATDYIPVKKGDKVRLHVAKKLKADANAYVYGYLRYNTSKTITENKNVTETQFSSEFVAYEDGYVRYSIAEMPNGGSLGDIVLRTDDFSTADVIACYEKRGSVMNDISHFPAYWNDEIQTSMDAVIEHEVSATANLIEFFFVTDVHWRYNAGWSSAIISQMSRQLNIPLVLCGGDVIGQENDTVQGAGDELQTYYGTFDNALMIFPTLGNHDSNYNNTATAAKKLSDVALYNLIFKIAEKYTNTHGSIDVFAYDNESLKVRFIQYKAYNYRDTYDANIVSAVGSLIAEKGAEWTIVLMAHAYYPDDNWATGQQYANAIATLYDNCSATIACLLVGHNHNDLNTTITSEGGKTIRVISTTSDAYGLENSAGYDMIPGTDTEQAFDVVQIDRTARKIYMTRVGAGADREFSY